MEQKSDARKQSWGKWGKRGLEEAGEQYLRDNALEEGENALEEIGHRANQRQGKGLGLSFPSSGKQRHSRTLTPVQKELNVTVYENYKF